MNEIIAECYENCSIVLINFSDKRSPLYEVHHQYTHKIVHLVYLAEAFRVAHLLELEHLVVNKIIIGWNKDDYDRED